MNVKITQALLDSLTEQAKASIDIIQKTSPFVILRGKVRSTTYNVDGVIFECKEGPFVPHEVEEVLEL